MAELLDLVRAHRLVTLAGPGGAGKTRLAVEMALALEGAPDGPDGVWMVELATAADAGSVLRSIVTQLGLDQLALAGSGRPPRRRGWRRCSATGRSCWSSTTASRWSTRWPSWSTSCWPAARSSGC